MREYCEHEGNGEAIRGLTEVLDPIGTVGGGLHFGKGVRRSLKGIHNGHPPSQGLESLRLQRC